MFELYKSICSNCIAAGCQRCEDMATNREKINGIKCPELNMFVYHTLPPGMRLATMSDFVKNTLIQTGLGYLLKSHFAPKYVSGKLSDLTDLAEIQRFIELDSCFVKSEL